MKKPQYTHPMYILQMSAMIERHKTDVKVQSMVTMVVFQTYTALLTILKFSFTLSIKSVYFKKFALSIVCYKTQYNL